ncbi:MAG: coniferyl aldehyde dehydrogenase [Pseudomonadota bacterium]|nr:coniferyl aldehyde dehydrogenase [Pseudomonadota bacterium]
MTVSIAAPAHAPMDSAAVALASERERGAARLQFLFEQQTRSFQDHPYPPLAERREWLTKLEQSIRSGIPEIQAALDSDFGHRCEEETLLAEVMGSLKAISYARRRLKSWMKSRHRGVDATFQPATARVMPQPLGVVGIMAPWNYPFGLVIKPLIAALAAGNRVMIKPSELTPCVSRLLYDMLGGIFPESQVCVVEGDEHVARAFTALPFDHLLFTGSTSTGKQVMAAAALNLTPLTLELGGKSPAIIGEDYDMDLAAKSIVTGKALNCGQTCTAPDYVLVPAARLESFIDSFSTTMRRMYPDPVGNPDYTCVINERHYDRLHGYVSEAAELGARVVEVFPEKQSDRAARKLLPALVVDPPEASRVMHDEIFGPLLIVIPYLQLKDAMDFINRRPRPLALYVFTNDRAAEENIIRGTVSGGVTVNDTLLHYTQESLPFGGVGSSGFGAYHGERGFKTFSHVKPIFRQSRINFVDAVRAPYGTVSRWLLRKMIRMA